MKTKSIKNIFGKINAVLIVFLIISLYIYIPVSASSDTIDNSDNYNNDPNYTEWRFSDDRSKLMGKGKTYMRHTIPTCYFIDSDGNRYSYVNRYIVSTSKDSDIVWIGYEQHEYYATDDEQAKLSDFFRGDFKNFEMLVTDMNTYAGINKSFLTSLSDYAASHPEETTEYSVNQLADAEEVYRFIAYDDSRTFCYYYGTVYRIDNNLMYLDMNALDNTHFDADGNFSYRRGSVSLLALNDSQISELSEKERLATDRITSYDNEYIRSDISGKFPFVFYWFIHITVGMAVPLTFAIILTCLLLSKAKHRRRLILPLALSIIWLTISIIAIPILL